MDTYCKGLDSQEALFLVEGEWGNFLAKRPIGSKEVCVCAL